MKPGDVPPHGKKEGKGGSCFHVESVLAQEGGTYYRFPIKPAIKPVPIEAAIQNGTT